MNNTTSIHRLMDFEEKATKIDINLWLDHEFLTFKWWILVALFIIPWIIWYKFVDHTRAIEILLFGTITMIFTLLLDSIGSDLSFWSYPVEFIPIGISGYIFDLSLVPVFFMLIYQNFMSWKSYIIALLCFAIIYAFICEPIMIWIGLVTYVKWKFIYSFIFYSLNGIFVKYLIQKLKRDG